MKNTYGVIMAGGVGKRFRPLSRTMRPKQFLDILGTGRTFIQQTYDRLSQFIPAENIIVVTGEDYRSLVAEQVPQVLPNNILCEPSRRNTAPCIAYAAYRLRQINPNATMVIAPSDHFITNDAEFERTIRDAVRFAQMGNSLVTIGIKPSRPETGYGYIQISEGAGSGEELGICKVKTFTEKPNIDLAKIFVESGEFYWNSGIFIWTIDSICKALDEHLPETAKLFSAGNDKYNTSQEAEFIAKTYAECKAISIDYGVMEKVENAYVLCANFGWSDLGNWTSLYINLAKDEQGNAIANSNVVMQDVSNSLIKTPPEKLVVLQGLDGYLVVDIADVLLVCPRGNAEDVAQIVDRALLEKGILE
jgi:mannose-1-phosphate guanylyltransferase